MSTNTSYNYLNNRCLNLCALYSKYQQNFINTNNIHLDLNESSDFSKNYELNKVVDKNKHHFNHPSNHIQKISLVKRKNQNENTFINPLDIFDNVSFVKIVDLNSNSSVISLIKIKYIKLIDKDGNIIFKELHKKDFKKSLFKKSISLDVLDKNIIFINFVDFNNNVKSIKLNQIQIIKLYDTKINNFLTKMF